ncbi:hypothetical protein E4U37_006953 [Claviceps purpurea]|nr:hypothetical protein E4U37_006953 [Claviceps purpurea]
MAQHDHSVRFSAGQHDGRSQTQRDEEEAEIGKYHDGPVMQPARRCQTVDDVSRKWIVGWTNRWIARWIARCRWILPAELRHPQPVPAIQTSA